MVCGPNGESQPGRPGDVRVRRTPDGLRAMHARLRRDKGPASNYACTCGAQASDWAYNHEDPAPKLSPDRRGTWMWWSDNPDMYVPMCRKCHRNFDAKRARDELAEYRRWKFVSGMAELPEFREAA